MIGGISQPRDVVHQPSTQRHSETYNVHEIVVSLSYTLVCMIVYTVNVEYRYDIYFKEAPWQYSVAIHVDVHAQCKTVTI